MNCMLAEVAECKPAEALRTPTGCNLAVKCKLVLVECRLVVCSIPVFESTELV